MKPNPTAYYRRFPVTHPSHVVNKVAGKQIRRRAERYFRGRLLEIGCGTKIKHQLIGDLVEKHVGLDHEDTPHDKSNIDLYGPPYDIPANDHSFDCILSTAVLEHLEGTCDAAGEAFRVLKSGGYGLYTAPLFWHIHEAPRDFFRYTRYGLTEIFEEAGFEVVEIAPLSGFITTFGTELNYYIQRFGKGPFKPLVKGWIGLNNILMSFLDRGRLLDERFTWMYIMIVRKPKSKSDLER
jgi:SAM-dependent methyltransferase